MRPFGRGPAVAVCADSGNLAAAPSGARPRWPATFFGVHSGLAMGAIHACGSEELKACWLPGMARHGGVPPGGQDPVHRHDAHAFVYVLEGSIVMQVKGGKEVTLKPGQTFYEGPDDVHLVGRNASCTKPAKFVVVLVKEQGAPVLVPTK